MKNLINHIQIYLSFLIITLLFDNTRCEDTQNIITIPLTFEDGNLYLKAAIGSMKQDFKMVPDSLRTVSNVMSDSNSKAENVRKFNKGQSETNKKIQDNYVTHINNYELIGDLTTDSIKLAESSKGKTQMDDAKINVVTDLKNRKEIRTEGYLGLGFVEKPEEHFISVLKKNSIVKNAVYSTLLTQMNTGYFELHLGGIDEKIIKNSTEKEKIQYTNVTINTNTTEKEFFPWYLTSNKIILNRSDTDGTLVNKTYKVVINTAGNEIRIPKKFFLENIKKLTPESSKCQYSSNDVFNCKCKSRTYKKDFANYTFFLNDTSKEEKNVKTFNITITPEDYINIAVDSGNSNDEVNCVMLISLHNKDDYFVLGKNFLNNFYLIFDVEEKKVGFYPMDRTYSGNMQGLIILITIVAASSLIFFSALYCIYKKIMERYRNQQHEPLERLSD
jgi:hypothetical protein